MKLKELVRTAQSILDTNTYLTLATTDGKHAWVAPLYYCRDRKNRFYVISQPHCRHARHIALNSRVSFAVFDSRAPEGVGNGVQGTGHMTQLFGRSLKYALKYYHTDYIPCTETSFMDGPYRMYQLTPERMYVLDPDAPVDKRVKWFG